MININETKPKLPNAVYDVQCGKCGGELRFNKMHTDVISYNVYCNECGGDLQISKTYSHAVEAKDTSGKGKEPRKTRQYWKKTSMGWILETEELLLPEGRWRPVLDKDAVRALEESVRRRSRSDVFSRESDVMLRNMPRVPSPYCVESNADCICRKTVEAKNTTKSEPRSIADKPNWVEAMNGLACMICGDYKSLCRCA